MKLDEQEYEQDQDYDQQILYILEVSPNPISAREISDLTGIRHDRVLKKLRKLQKYGIARISTKKTVNFWIKDD